MASSFFSWNSTSTTLIVLLLAFFSSLQCSTVASHGYQVGGVKGWIVPPSKYTNMFNIWASNNRFHVGDSINFKYKKDSVMEVGEEDYNDCNATQPTFFSNNGDTVFKLNHSGTFYFISGASGHCEKGQKMIVRVMVQDQDQHAKSSSGYHVSFGVFQFVFVVFAFLVSFM